MVPTISDLSSANYIDIPVQQRDANNIFLCKLQPKEPLLIALHVSINKVHIYIFCIFSKYIEHFYEVPIYIYINLNLFTVFKRKNKSYIDALQISEICSLNIYMCIFSCI